MKSVRVDHYIPRGRRSGHITELRYRFQRWEVPTQGQIWLDLMAAVDMARSLGFTHYRIGRRIYPIAAKVDGIAKYGRLVKTTQEKFNVKRGWFVTAWRVANVHGYDMLQPWSGSRGEAIETAFQCNITILEI